MNNLVDIQVALDSSSASHIPANDTIQLWVDLVLNQHSDSTANELTIRFVDNEESQSLNSSYRGKDKPTNVLSFPFENPPGLSLPLLGDLVVCVPVLEREAKEQYKSLTAHYAHMIVHGCLHLLGYDHINNFDAQQMEALEIALLAELGIDDPYEDD